MDQPQIQSKIDQYNKRLSELEAERRKVYEKIDTEYNNGDNFGTALKKYQAELELIHDEEHALEMKIENLRQKLNNS